MNRNRQILGRAGRVPRWPQLWALVALAALALGRDRALLPEGASRLSRRRALLSLPIVLFAAYVMTGTILRLTHIYEVGPNVRLAAAVSVAGVAAVYVTWPWIARLLQTGRWTTNAALGVAALVAAGQIAQFVQWAAGRTYKNYEASMALGRVLPPGTLVHGKLANGLSLDNRIKPVFVGREFGNYADRKRRDDVRYILTYVLPCVGYEGPVINDVLEAYPERRVLMTFDVAETSTGQDRAALVDKFGGRQPGRRPGEEMGRACD